MPLIPEDKIDEILQSTDLIDLIQRYLPLSRSGSTLKACCPFHQEKTPSFHVWPETQTWRCFGCGRGGSAFQFLMERERLTFPEAVTSLAQDAGIELGVSDSRGDGRIARVRDLMEWTCRFYELQLRAPGGRKAVEYCRSRKITGETAKRFRVGYAPDGWRTLLDAARQKGYSPELLEMGGLMRPARNEGQEPYDWFRDRLMFPIQDIRGRVIGFGGRALDDSEPKYLNSPDTTLFKKGQTLYALNLARDDAMREKRLGLVEGYTDVLMAHQHGVPYIVAGLGTGLTREHAGLARRYASRIDLIYDGDAAGARASERSLDVFLGEKVDVRVVTLPEGLDPCDFILERGRDAFLAELEAGQQVWDFLIGRAETRHELDTVNGRVAAVDEILSIVARIEDEFVQNDLIRDISERFRVKEPTVRARLATFSGRTDAVETGPAYEVDEFPEAREEEMILESVLGDARLGARLAEEWPPDKFENPQYRAIAMVMAALAADGRPIEEGAVMARIEDPATAARLTEISAKGLGKKNFERQFVDCVALLDRRSALAVARAALGQAIQDGDTTEERRLRNEVFRLEATQG